MTTILFFAVSGLFAVSVIVFEAVNFYTTLGVVGVVIAASLAAFGVVLIYDALEKVKSVG